MLFNDKNMNINTTDNNDVDKQSEHIATNINVLNQINHHISDISKISIKCDIVKWFQQSPLHWFMGLFIMKYYYENKELSKQLLAEEISTHISTEGKKTTTTEFRYFDDCESKGLIITGTSENDARKRKIVPTEKMIDSFLSWFDHHNQNFIELNIKKK